MLQVTNTIPKFCQYVLSATHSINQGMAQTAPMICNVLRIMMAHNTFWPLQTSLLGNKQCCCTPLTQTWLPQVQQDHEQLLRIFLEQLSKQSKISSMRIYDPVRRGCHNPGNVVNATSREHYHVSVTLSREHDWARRRIKMLPMRRNVHFLRGTYNALCHIFHQSTLWR